MASSNKKTFTTSETSKGATLEVTSNTVLLEPDTTDHVLVVKSSSNSNLTGDVDVELEMSPDGVNWCPAKVKQTTTTEEVQGDPVEGNEKSVNLIKDINESSDYKNKFARGKLEYDLGTNQAYQGNTIDEFNRTDASDFMHHMVATNKSFNFSGWFKSNEQPSSTYTPVLFRNGGIDTFENLKVIQTDSNTTSQNLCSRNLVNEKYLNLTPVPYGDNTSQSFTTTSTTVTSPFYNSTNQTNVFPTCPQTETLNANGVDSDLSGGFSIGFWLKVGTPSGTGNLYSSFFTLRLSNGDEFEIGGGRYNNSFIIFSRNAVNSTNHQYHFLNTTGVSSIPGSGWHYIIYNYNGSGNNFYAASLSIDGANPSVSTLIRGGYSTTMNSYDTNGVTIDSLDINTNYHSSTNGLGTDFAIDSLVFIEGNVLNAYTSASYLNDAATSLYNNANNPYNANLTSVQRGVSPFNGQTVYKFWSPTIRSFFKFGEGPNDNISTAGSETIEGDNGLELSVGSVTSNHSFPSYNAGDPPEEVTIEEFSTIFDTGVHSAISGWFKTTNTGILFSNTAGAAATGLTMEVNASNKLLLTLTDGTTTETLTSTVDVNGGQWHHMALVKPSGTTPTVSLYIDGVQDQTLAITSAISNTHLRGTNGFTLLGDGQENAGNSAATGTDASKLTAALSNWSLHTEALTAIAVKQLYSNGHVRNIQNLPDVNSANIAHWWKLSDTTSTEEDSAGTRDLFYVDGTTPTALSTKVIDATGEVLVQNQLNGNGMTLSLTKNFDFVNKQWVSDASGEAAICLCFNGFQEQAEYFVLWKTNQTTKSIDFLDNNWHNLVLSYKGRNDLQSSDPTSASYVQEGDIVKFGPLGSSGAYNWTLTLDGQCLKDITGDGQGELGADYIGGLGSGLNVQNNVNTGFAIYNRHFKFIGAPETYIAHTQGGATPIAISGLTVQPAVSAQDTPFSFQGYIDETSFHSQNFWQSAGGINNDIEQEFAATIYGNTAALPLRGASAPNYATGIPYPLNDPTAIGAVSGTSQYVNPDRLDASTNPHGGLEAWWRWGDTPQDCAENIHDAIDYAASTTQTPVVLHHLRAIEIDQGDVTAMTSADSIYLADFDGVTPASVTTEFVQVVIQGIVNTACNVRDIADPILQYLRVKFKGAGSTDLGKNKTEASLWYRKRRKK